MSARRTPNARILINSGAPTVVAALTLSGCSSNSDTVEKPVNLNAQKELTVPNVVPAQMIVPPAPTVHELPAVQRVTDKKTKYNGDAPTWPGNDTNVTDGNDLYPRTDDKSVGDKRGAGEPVTKDGVTNEFVAKLTGADSVDHTDSRWGVSGAGNAVLWDNGKGQVITMFGGTFGGPRPRGEGGDQAPLVSGDGLNLPIMPKGVSFPALPYVNLHQGANRVPASPGTPEPPDPPDWVGAPTLSRIAPPRTSASSASASSSPTSPSTPMVEPGRLPQSASAARTGQVGRSPSPVAAKTVVLDTESSIRYHTDGSRRWNS